MKLAGKEWLMAASDDLAVIDCLVGNSELTHMIAFHAQQCIEKCLKAIIEEHGLDFAKIHSLRRLFKICADYISLNENDGDLVDILDELYIDSRYPGEIGLLPNGKPTQTDAQQFHRFAKEIHHKISTQI